MNQNFGAVILEESRKYNGINVTAPLSHAMERSDPWSNLRANVMCRGLASPSDSVLTIGMVDILVTLGG